MTWWPRKANAWFARHKTSIGTVAVGHAAKRIEEILFDWFLYGTVITVSTSWWGVVNGSLAAFFVMLPLSALICAGYLRFYDWAKKDWFGFEAIKEFVGNSASRSPIRRAVESIAQHGGIPAFVVLSIYGDPFLATIFLRRGTQYAGLSRRDWIVFWASVVVSNGYWTLRWVAIVEVIRIGYRLLET